jgi:hypothetical protein
MIELYDEHGRKLASGTIVPDGGKIKVPMTMMDGALDDISEITRRAMADTSDQAQAALLHRPGFGITSVSDADRASREQAIADREQLLVDAWKQPPALQASQSDPAQPTTPLTAATAADQRDARLRSAWEG